MFTDIVGYTALTQADEDRAIQLLETHNRLIRPLLAKYRGIEVKTIGDSFLVEFSSALDALRCAAEIQSAIHAHNSSIAQGPDIRVRIGIHLGDVIHREGDVFGDAVNISSRIETLAEPGGICISRQVYDQVRNKFELPLVSLGEKALKNLDSPVEVYGVKMSWDGQRDQGGTDARRVAVLPFSNLSPDPADEYFADGMTEELISTVARIDGTEVISRTSVMQYKKSPKPIRQISAELDAGTVLEGSIRKAGNRLRVTVQMIDAARDRHLWSESYDRDLDDVFAIQSDIAGRVAEALKARMVKETPRSAGSTDNLEAYTAYLRAKQLLYEGKDRQVEEAVSLLESAVAKDPNFSEAYSNLARAFRHLGTHGDYTALMKKAEEMGRKAIATCPESADAHAAMGSVHVALDRFEAAREEVETAVHLNPNLSDAHALLGEINGAFGRLDEAIASQRKAYALDPVSLYAACLLAETLRVAGRVEEALRIIERMEKLYPDSIFLCQSASACYIQTNDLIAASQKLEAGMRSSPGNMELRVEKAILDALDGRRDDALEELRHITAEASASTSAAASMRVNASLGNLDEAFAALDELALLHSWPALVKSDPQLEVLRRDPRFSRFCRQVGIQT
jgi:adenylate cyclase